MLHSHNTNFQMKQCARLDALSLPSDNWKYELAIITYEHRTQHKVSHGRDVASTLLGYEKENYSPHVAESQGKASSNMK